VLSYEEIHLFLNNNPSVSLRISSNATLFLLFLITTIISCSVIGKLIGSWLHKKLYPDTIPFPSETSQNNPNSVCTSETSDSSSYSKIKAEQDSASAETNVEAIPLTATEAAAQNALSEIKKEFEEKISTGTFEDPNVVIEHPGEMLVETPATLFSKEPVKEPEKPELPDESFPRKELIYAVPRPPGCAPPVPKPAK
jgi:hypothetical protein